jgi:hypothetical protein
MELDRRQKSTELLHGAALGERRSPRAHGPPWLKVIHPVEFDRRVAKLSMGCVYRANRQLGPAGQCLIPHLPQAIDS